MWPQKIGALLAIELLCWRSQLPIPVRRNSLGLYSTRSMPANTLRCNHIRIMSLTKSLKFASLVLFYLFVSFVVHGMVLSLI